MLHNYSSILTFGILLDALL